MDTRGLPLLSGPPPANNENESACRKCNKEFTLFTRTRRCNHCGYLYCHSCTDFQALMPRSTGQPGHDVMPVCAFCIEFLNVTASGRGQLRTMPLSKLRKYVAAYNIKDNRAVEKDDLIDAMVAARGPNGCLRPANEEYYRRNSIPGQSGGNRPRGIFSRTEANRPPPPPPPQSRPAPFPRPDLGPDYPLPPQPPGPETRPRPPPPVPPRDRSNPSNTQAPRPPRRTRPTPNQHPFSAPPTPPTPPTPPRQPRHAFPTPGTYQQPPMSQSTDNLNARRPDAERARTTSTSRPPPTLDDLLEMSQQDIANLSISALKAILFTNHVNSGFILEKGELVTKVNALVEEEAQRRERQRMVEILEQAEAMPDMQSDTSAEIHPVPHTESAEDGDTSNDERPENEDDGEQPPRVVSPKPKATPGRSLLERDGLCVVCYDHEANIAVVDCGHLAMCRECADLVMASSRECPLCRTRIVTESRLLRIFKT